MSEMAYGFDAVQLTMDAMLSSCCREDEEIERDEERERDREKDGGWGEGDLDKVAREEVQERDGEVQGTGASSPSSSSSGQVHSLPFKKKRSAAYERWLSAPDTPYRRVRYFLAIFCISPFLSPSPHLLVLSIKCHQRFNDSYYLTTIGS